jgi:DNA-directed RNA polymerase alpha subunit
MKKCLHCQKEIQNGLLVAEVVVNDVIMENTQNARVCGECIYVHAEIITEAENKGAKVVNMYITSVEDEIKWFENELANATNEDDIKIIKSRIKHRKDELEMLAAKRKQMRSEQTDFTNSSSKEEQKDIVELDLSNRSYVCLKRAGINTISKLKQLTLEELSNVYRIGKAGVKEVQDKLQALGVSNI